MKLPFTKMHGLGNDFVVIDGRRHRLPNPKQTVRFIGNRRLGIGADQILVLEKSRKADFKMVIYNADGSDAEMCGNGIRCLAKFVRDEKLTTRSELTVETAAGIQSIKVLSRNRIQVDMGAPILKGAEIPVKLSGRVINRPVRVDSQEFRITCVSMGNPHCVIFVKELKGFPVATTGPLLEKHSLFPRRVNVEFVKVLSPRQVEMRVWERGAGETMACGSGACAVAVASALNGFTERTVTVKLLGGVLEIEWSREDGHVYMTGGAETVFKGEVDV